MVKKEIDYQIMKSTLDALENNVKNRSYRQFRHLDAGFRSFASIRNRLHRQAIDIPLIVLYLFCNERTDIDTPYINIKFENAFGSGKLDYNDVLLAVKDIKKGINMQRNGVSWRSIAQEIGYVTESGVLSRSMNARLWSPIDLIWTICNMVGVQSIIGESGSIKIKLLIKKPA